MKQLFRLELDENGEADAADFTDRAEALRAFQTAIKRKSVFSARIDIYDEDTHERIGTDGHFERR